MCTECSFIGLQAKSSSCDPIPLKSLVYTEREVQLYGGGGGDVTFPAPLSVQRLNRHSQTMSAFTLLKGLCHDMSIYFEAYNYK
jgi:hypothetical protein